MERLREMKFYNVFDGQEISELFDLLKEKLDYLKLKEQKYSDDNDVLKALNMRTERLNYLYQDMAYMWSEMIKDGHWNGVRSKRMFVKD